MIYLRPGFVCRPPLLVAWNQQDKGSNIDLSGGLLTATCNATLDNAVRANKYRGAGKWYWEINGTNIGGGDTGMGLASAAAVLTAIGGSVANAYMQFRGGNRYNNGSILANNGNMSGGGVLQICYDGTAHLAWLKFSAGNWNANAANDPAAGTGGSSTAAWDTGGLVPCFCVSVSGDAAVLNAGATSFSFTPPTGFLPGNSS